MSWADRTSTSEDLVARREAANALRKADEALAQGDAATWAEEGNTDDIPLSKLPDDIERTIDLTTDIDLLSSVDWQTADNANAQFTLATISSAFGMAIESDPFDLSSIPTRLDPLLEWSNDRTRVVRALYTSVFNVLVRIRKSADVLHYRFVDSTTNDDGTLDRIRSITTFSAVDRVAEDDDWNYFYGGRVGFVFPPGVSIPTQLVPTYRLQSREFLTSFHGELGQRALEQIRETAGTGLPALTEDGRVYTLRGVDRLGSGGRLEPIIYWDRPLYVPSTPDLTSRIGYVLTVRSANTGDIHWARGPVSWAQAGNNDAIPASKLTNVSSSGGADTTARNAAAAAQSTADTNARNIQQLGQQNNNLQLETGRNQNAITNINNTIANYSVFDHYQLIPAGFTGTTLPDFLSLIVYGKRVNKTISRVLVTMEGTPLANLVRNTNPTPPATDPLAPFNQTTYPLSGGVINLTFGAGAKDNIETALGAKTGSQFEYGTIRFEFTDGTVAIDRFHYGINNNAFAPPPVTNAVDSIARADAAEAALRHDVRGYVNPPFFPPGADIAGTYQFNIINPINQFPGANIVELRTAGENVGYLTYDPALLSQNMTFTINATVAAALQGRGLLDSGDFVPLEFFIQTGRDIATRQHDDIIYVPVGEFHPTYRALTGAAQGGNVWTFTLRTSDTELYIRRTNGNGFYYGRTFPRMEFTTTDRTFLIESRNPSTDANNEASSLMFRCRINGNNLRIDGNVGGRKDNLPAVYAK